MTAVLRRWRHGPAALGYVALTTWVLWPAVLHFRTRAMADGVDAAMFTWLWGAMPDALGAGRDPFRTDLIFHPVGADLRLTTSAPLISLLTWPVRATLGLDAQVNVVQLGSMFLAGFATYLLAERVCRHRGAAFVAGVAYALLPARFVHVDSHLNLVETAVIPFGLLLLLRFMDGPSGGRAVAVGAGLGAAFLIEPQLAVLLGIGLVAMAVAHREVLRRQGRRLAWAGAVALLVAAPLLVPMAGAMLAGNVGDPDPTQASLLYSSSPLSWVVPPFERLWLGHLWTPRPLTPTSEGVAYPGLVLLGLAVAGVSLTDRVRRRGWVAISLVGFVLSLGPYLFVRDTSLDVPLPFFLLRAIPGLDAVRVPGRFALLGAIGICVLAAAALADLGRRLPQRSRLILGLVGLVTLLELYPRDLPSRPGVPAVYGELADAPGDGAVLEVPLKWSTTQQYFGFDGHDRDFMFLLYQQAHGRPIVSGAVSRYPDDALRALVEEPVYRQLLALGGEDGFDDPATFDRDDLADLGIGFVVYHRRDPAPQVLEHLRSLDLPVLADDGDVIIWTVGR